jgi:tape measure domain-containing protein
MSGTEAFRLYGTVGVDPKPAMRGLDDLSGHVKKSGGIIENAMGTALGMMGGQAMLSIIDRGVGFLKGAAIDYNAAMEQASIGFTTLLGSAEKAQSFIADLQKFAATTPFDFPSLQKSANQLLAMGFSAEEVVPTLTSLGDAVAALGGGPEMIGRATQALGKMKATGKVTGETMMQISEMGIPAWKLLAKQLGVSTSKAQEMVSKGLVPANVGIKAITKGIKESNMGGMMAEQSATFVGAMSNITDTVTQAAATAFQPFFEMVSTGAQALATWMGSKEGSAFFQGVQKAVQGVISVLASLVGVVLDMAGAFVPLVSQGGVIRGVFDTIVGAIKPLWTAALGVGKAILGVVQAITGGGPDTEKFSTSVGELGTTITTYITTWLTTIPALLVTLGAALVNWIVDAVPGIAIALGNVATALATGIRAALPGMGTALGELGTAIITWITDEAPKVAAKMLVMAGELVDWIGPQVPLMLEELLKFVEAATDWVVTTGIPLLVDSLLKMAQELIAWVLPQVGPLLGKLLGLMVSVTTWIFTVGIPRLAAAALKMGVGLVTGFMDLLLGKSGQPGLISQLATYVTTKLVPDLVAFGPKLFDAAVKLGAQIVSGIVNGLVGLPGKIADAVAAAFEGLDLVIGPFHITSKGISVQVDLPKFATGSWSVPNTGPAIIHKGEMVIPADVAARLRKFGGQVGGGSSAPMLAQAAVGGGNTTILVEIGTFYGSQANIDALSRSLAERARASRF